MIRLVPFLLLLPALCIAQGSATIFGSVRDSSGAIIVGAQVTLARPETGTTRTARTGADGGYLFGQLAPGGYEVRAEASGFKAVVQKGIELQVDENRQVNFGMEVGQVTESISVTADAAQVETRSSTLKEVVDSRRISELPLNGRNPLQLQFLVPGAGANQGRGQGQNDTLSINGVRSNQNNYQLDGADNHDPFFNSASIFPSPDALEEFTLSTSSYGADRGRAGGAFMAAVTKSGTNQFHGSLFEFLRNEKLMARNYFSTTVAPFRRNQFGGTIGGPVVKNRLFFFASYQGTLERSAPGARTAIVPSSAMRQGNLQELNRVIRDPLGGNFPNAIIPASRLSQPSQGFLNAFVPLPNLPGNLYSFNVGQGIDDHQGVAKIDYAASSRHNLSARLLRNQNIFKEAVGTLPDFFAFIDYTTWNATATHTWTISPSLLSVFTLTWGDITRNQIPSSPKGLSWADFGAGITRGQNTDLPPSVDSSVDGYFTANTRGALMQTRTNWQFTGQLSWTKGSHLIRFGGDYRPVFTTVREFFRGDGHFQFRNNFTGVSIADFLIGRPSVFIQQSGLNNDPRQHEIGLFIQDDWRVNRRLTLNLGLRWDPWLPYKDLEDRVVGFRPGQKSTMLPTAPVGLVTIGDAGFPEAGIVNQWGNFGPRIGFAFDPTGSGKSSIRGGYGIFYGMFPGQGTNGIGNNQPFTVRLNTQNPAGGLLNPYLETGNPYPFTPPDTEEERRAFKFVTPIAMSAYDASFRNPISQQWNFTLQRQFGSSWVATGAYVGSKGNQLLGAYQANAAVFGAPGNTVDSRRPYFPGFGSISLSSTRNNSVYHSMQLSVNKRFTSSFTVLANYTWSKLIDDGDGPANPNNWRAERGLGSNDLAHRFVASYIYTLPRLAQAHPVFKWVFGGWETNGIVTLQGGTMLDLNSGADNSQTGINSDRPDLIGDPYLPADRSRSELIARYFNTSAFQTNARGTFGTTPRNIIRGPGLITADLGVSKVIPIRESVRLQVRGEFFNAFNRVNLNNPNSTFGNTAFGRITGARDPRVVQVAMRLIF